MVFDKFSEGDVIFSLRFADITFRKRQQGDSEAHGGVKDEN